MKFIIVEDILTAQKRPEGMLYIYENPSLKDLNGKNESRGNRGVIDEEGNLYVESFWSETEEEPYSYIIHSRMIDLLHKESKVLKLNLKTDKEWMNPLNSLDYGVCVQRNKSSSDFYLSESYRNIDNEALEKITKFYDLAKKKNPQFNFYTKQIHKIRPTWGKWTKQNETQNLSGL